MRLTSLLVSRWEGDEVERRREEGVVVSRVADFRRASRRTFVRLVDSCSETIQSSSRRSESFHRKRAVFAS